MHGSGLENPKIRKPKNKETSKFGNPKVIKSFKQKTLKLENSKITNF